MESSMCSHVHPMHARTLTRANRSCARVSNCAVVCAAASVGESLLTPTKIYVKALLPLLNRGGVLKAMAHITGGGLPENIPRVLPKDLAAQVDLAALKLPPVFQWLRAESGLAPWELTKTFNCGVGMVLVVPPAKVAECLQLLEAQGETAFQIGSIVPRAEGGEQVVLNGELA